MLAPFPKVVHHAIMTSTWRPTVTDGSSQDCKVLKAAFDLLKTTGYMLQDSKMLDREGRLFTFEILTSSEVEQRIAAIYQRTLEKLGMAVTIRALEADQIQICKQRFDFDVLIGAIRVSVTLSPGIEKNSFGGGGQVQRKSRAHYNLAGVANQAIDTAIEATLRAREMGYFVATTRVLDRLLMSGHYMVPTQHNSKRTIASNGSRIRKD